MAEKYITEEQRAGCRKVADAFAERSWIMTRYSRRFLKTGRRKYWKKRNILFPGVRMLSAKKEIFLTIPECFLLQ